MRLSVIGSGAAVTLGVTAVGSALAATGAAMPTAPARAATAPARSGEVRLAGSLAPAVAGRRAVGEPAADQAETVQLWLAGDEAAAQRYVNAVSTPGSASYGDFLSPQAYTRRFGPRPAQVRTVRAFLIHRHFSAVTVSTDADYVSASAPVATIDRAFSVQMRRYRLPGTAQQPQAIIDANDRALSLPATLGPDVLAVTGLDSAQTPSAATPARPESAASAQSCSRYWDQRSVTISPAYQGESQAALPICGYSAAQLRGGYDLSGADTGRGVTVAVIQVGAPSQTLEALRQYVRAQHLPALRPGRFRTVTVGARGHHCIDYSPFEAELDSETLEAFAPEADQLVSNGCYDGKNEEQALLDAELAPLTGRRTAQSPTIETSSYDLGGEGTPAGVMRANHAIALRAAAEGVSQLWDAGDDAGVLSPADDPDVTAVGGTVLGLGAQDQRLFETGDFDDYGERLESSGAWTDTGSYGTGGGASVVYAEPAYQKQVVPAALAENSRGRTGRTVPDISADADSASGLLIDIAESGPHHSTLRYSASGAGTSMATPLIAGIVADAEQTTHRGLGLLNPLLYSLTGTPAFHDIVALGTDAPQTDRLLYESDAPVEVDNHYGTGDRAVLNDAQGPVGDHQVTAPGYDDITGLGSPNGPDFIAALRRASAHRSSR